MNKDYIQINVDTRQLASMIKKYYVETCQCKSCSVEFVARNIKDRLKELDLFHSDNNYYSHMFKTIVRGKIEDNNGNVHKYKEELDLNATKEVIANAISSQFGFDADTVSIAAVHNKNRDGGFDINIVGASCTINKKLLLK